MKKLAEQLLQAQVEDYASKMEAGLDAEARIANYRNYAASVLDHDANIINHMYKEFKSHGATVPIEKAMQTLAETVIVKEGESPYIPKPGKSEHRVVQTYS